MAPPITGNPSTYVPPPSDPATQQPISQIERYAPRWLKPTMFGVMRWQDIEIGLTPTQANAIYHWLSKIDTQQAVARYSFGSFGRDMLRQAIARVGAEIPSPPPATEPTTNPVIPSEPISPGQPYDPTKDPDYRGNTYIPPPSVPPPVIAQPPTNSNVVTEPPGTTNPKGYVEPPVVAQLPPNAMFDPSNKPTRESLGRGYDYVWNPTGRGYGQGGQWEARYVGGVVNPTVTPDVAGTDTPTVDWKSYLPDKWKSLANNGTQNPNWWKSYFDYDSTQRRFAPKSHLGTMGLTAFTIPQIGGGTGPYVQKPVLKKVMY